MTDVGVQTSQADAASLSFPLPADIVPADLAAELVAALPERDGEEYLLYEHDGHWVLAIGAVALGQRRNEFGGEVCGNDVGRQRKGQ